MKVKLFKEVPRELADKINEWLEDNEGKINVLHIHHDSINGSMYKLAYIYYEPIYNVEDLLEIIFSEDE